MRTEQPLLSVSWTLLSCITVKVKWFAMMYESRPQDEEQVNVLLTSLEGFYGCHVESQMSIHSFALWARLWFSRDVSAIIHLNIVCIQVSGRQTR